ncbi:unnamed protein product [Parnassius apollo]|uniref:(apollo) hypothetical protein n=1 Tax=Parnassius apollo TaxID=110799 RepID=A0A8S3VYN3_PARAO|nr:unnamed protein product [Parnassius apollo]
MRRGHKGIGGWRSENTRHFRSRGGGNPHFRPRSYPLLDAHRFPPPPLHRPPPFVSRPDHMVEHNTEQNRNKFRFDNRKNQNKPYEKHSEREIFPHLQHFKHNDMTSRTNTYKESNYYVSTKQNDGFIVNSHGDVDHRQTNVKQNCLSFRQQPVTSWIPPAEHKIPPYDNKNQNKSYRCHEEQNKLPILDYPGHRPPSSDHYGGNPTPSIDNSNTFSRSVDDTVNIVRKRLLDRNESHHVSDNARMEKFSNNLHRENSVTNYHDNSQQEQPTKRRIQRQKQKNKTNCDKIKNKIFHQLFKMDKEKIHKLMDNPNSSSKFEYAISSLITESQNSFNRHLRSVAEKSLCSSSTDFMQNDNNTIYEDTFLKQMQCLLDPQDTVLLEDIKPIVMAELSKVLQLDNIEQQFVEGESTGHHSETHSNYDQYHSAFGNYELSNYPEEYIESDFAEQHPSQTNFKQSDTNVIGEIRDKYDNNQPNDDVQSKPLFERRSRSKSYNYNEERALENQYTGSNHDYKSNEDIYQNRSDPSELFDPITEQISDDEDPFAELDNQYHVDVDHNFIDNEDISSTQQIQKTITSKSLTIGDTDMELNRLKTPQKGSISIKQEIDSQILDIAKSPLKLSSNINKKDNFNESENKGINIKNEPGLIENMNTTNTMNIDKIPIPEDNRTDKSQNSCVMPKSLASSNSRKRAIDQQSSHRKEKRKKIDFTPTDSSKQILNKDVIINVNDCTSNPSEKCDTAKSIFNLRLSKDEGDSKIRDISKETIKTEVVDKEYSDKYVKRKDIEKKTRERSSEPKKKHNSDSPSHSNFNLKENAANTNNQTTTKIEVKNTLKTIDMFVEKPKKLIHHAHRNTVVIPGTKNTKTNIDKKKKNLKRGSNRKSRRHIATQVLNKLVTKETQTVETKTFCTRFCQTEKGKLCVQAVQTDPVYFEKSNSRSTDAFERMKEIDLEIQVLLQEKFKLYSSLENKDSSQNSLQTLGMTVLNVTPLDEDVKEGIIEVDSISSDAIADDFTNIPVEDLEQIAFETVEAERNENFEVEKRSRRNTVLEEERKSSISPKAAMVKKNGRKSRTPNISLIEQIITDDRPLEDIIALDDYEKPIKTRRPKVQRSKKKATKKTKPMNTLGTTFELKECSVVLIREDLSKILLQNTIPPIEYQESLFETAEQENIVEIDITEKENSVINDVQFDMLDVSEDIVIGDNCEIKSLQDKELEIIDVPISEEIILDNSQSSYEDIIAPQVLSGDNECKMYDYSADENLRRDSITVTGNADAVLAIECIDNNFIAACLDGNVYYFSGDGQLINTLRGSNLAVTCLTIVKEKYETTVYTGSLDSRIRYYDLETGLERGPECNVLSPIQTMDRAWDTIFVGTRTGFVLQFECKNNILIPVSTVKFSDQSILALRAMKEGPRKVLLVAARSENVTIKDAQTGLLLRTLTGPKMTVYTLLYEDGKVYCGTSSHQIQVFDYTSGSHVGTHEGGKGAVCLRATGGLLFAGCYDGCVYVYREGEARPMAQLRGPGLMLLSLAVVGSKIIAGYKDRSLYIWKIPLSILQEMIL